MKKRHVQVCVISDVHLGTFGCRAKELLNYLKSIKPQLLILNGDFIDIWQFSKSYFPKSHMSVIKEIIKLATKGTKVIYITGNHDEALRKYSDIDIGNIKLTDKLVFEINNEKAWVFHGDVFDLTSTGSAKIIAKLGGYGYDLLIMLNSLFNWILELIGKEKMSFSKKVKNSVKRAVSWIGNFEQTAAELAIDNNYQYVICGHIHQPQVRNIMTKKGTVCYMNSGDWIENLSALELNNNSWEIYTYNKHDFELVSTETENHLLKKDNFCVMTEEIAFKVSSLQTK